MIFFIIFEFFDFAKLGIINANIFPWLHKRNHCGFFKKSFINVTTSDIAYGRNLAFFFKKNSLEILRVLGHFFSKNLIALLLLAMFFFKKWWKFATLKNIDWDIWNVGMGKMFLPPTKKRAKRNVIDNNAISLLSILSLLGKEKHDCL